MFTIFPNILLKELLYFRTNRPLFTTAYSILLIAVYCLHLWNYKGTDSEEHKLQYFDNFRFPTNNFVKFVICLPKDVVDLRFSRANDAIKQIKARYRFVFFVQNRREAHEIMNNRTVDLLVEFEKLIETGLEVKYSINSREGTLNTHFCTNCDSIRKEMWGKAMEAQMVVNNFIALTVTRKTATALYLSQFEDFNYDASFLKTQNDLFYTWLMLLPWCIRCINVWNDDKKSGLYRNLLSLKVNRIEYILSKFAIWYLILLIPTMFLWAASYILVPSTFVIQTVEFLIVYLGCIVMFCMFLGQLFDRSVLFAKLVWIFLMAAGQFGMGNVYYGIMFFQTAVRFVGATYKAEHFDSLDADIGEALSISCIFANWVIMLILTIYLDYYNYSYRPGGFPFYYPLCRWFWSFKLRPPQVDPFFEVQQVQVEKLKTVESTMQSAPPLLTVTGICRRVEKCWKVNAVNFVAKIGEITTLYGHCGCGAKEILEILHGEAHADFGYISEEAERKLSTAKATCIPQLNYMTVRQYLKFFGSIRGAKPERCEIQEIMDDLDLSKIEDRELDLLTRTQLERLRIAAAFSGQSDVVLINRPTRDTFNDAKALIIQFIEKHKKNRAVIIATYDSEEAELLTNELVMMSEGYVVLEGNIKLFNKSINSVFEIRLWPVRIFSSTQIKEIKKIISCDDEKLAKDLQAFETPNGKLRVTLPILYRRSIPLIMKQVLLEKELLDVEHFELSTPTLHDIYTNACFDAKQFAPLATYDKLKGYYKAQEQRSAAWNFLKILLQIFTDARFLYEVIVCLVLFGLLATSMIFAVGSMHASRTTTTIAASTRKQYIYCNGEEYCKNPEVSNIVYQNSARPGNKINKYTMGINFTANPPFMNAYAFGDERFTMSMANYQLERFLHMEGHENAHIVSDLENHEVHATKDAEEFSPFFPKVSAQHAALIMADAQMLLYIMTLAQVFIYTISALLPLRLVRMKLSHNNQLFTWSKWSYFMILFLCNVFVFLLLSCAILGALQLCGFFPTESVTCLLILESMWLCVFLSTMPLVYFLVYTVSSAAAIIPAVLAIPFICASLPNVIFSYSAENSLSIETLLSMITSLLIFSPPTTLQFLAAFLSAGEAVIEYDMAVSKLMMLCCAHLWVVLVFLYAICRPDIKQLMQCWFLNKIRVTAPFDRRSALRIDKATTHKAEQSQHPAAQQQQQQAAADGGGLGSIKSTNGESRKNAGADEVEKNAEKEESSDITKYEEDLILEVARMKNWTDQQSIEVNDNASYVIGDQAMMMSRLLQTVAEMNDNHQIAFLPWDTHLPDLFTPRQLLKLSAACQGVTVTEEHVDYLLDLFSIEKNKKVRFLDDSDKRIVLLLSKIVKKPTMIIMDQTDMYLPYSKLMTLWALCNRMREDGLAVMFSSPNHLWAEHMATSIVHVLKCQFMTVQTPQEMKRKITHMLLDVEVRDEKKTSIVAAAIKFALKDSIYHRAPSKHRFVLEIPSDDIDMIETVIGVVKAHTKMISKYSMKMGTIEDYLNMVRP